MSGDLLGRLVRDRAAAQRNSYFTEDEPEPEAPPPHVDADGCARSAAPIRSPPRATLGAVLRDLLADKQMAKRWPST
jgi:hypothetical protein